MSRLRLINVKKYLDSPLKFVFSTQPPPNIKKPAKAGIFIFGGDDYMDVGGRAMQELLPREGWATALPCALLSFAESLRAPNRLS